MSLPSLLSSVLPFPVSLNLPDVSTPADLADPGLAEAIAKAVAQEAQAQGATLRWAWAYGVLVAEVVTGWAVGPGVEREAAELEAAAARATSATGIDVPRLYVAPTWEALEEVAEDVAQHLETAWLEARRRSQEEKAQAGGVRWLTTREAAQLAGMHVTALRDKVIARGRIPSWGLRRVGRQWLIREDALWVYLAHGRRRRPRRAGGEHA